MACPPVRGTQTDMSRQPTESVSDDICVGSDALHAFDEFVTQPHEARRLLGHFRASYLRGFSQADDACHVLVPDRLPLSCRRPKERTEWNFFTDDQCPTPLVHSACEPIGQEIDPVALHINRQLADRLHRIGMKYRAVVTGDTRKFCDGLDGADDVLRRHDRDQPGLGAERFRERLGLNDAIAIGHHVGHGDTSPFQMPTCFHDRRMFERARHDVRLAFEQFNDTERRIIGLSAACGETTSQGLALRSRATCSRADSTA